MIDLEIICHDVLLLWDVKSQLAIYGSVAEIFSGNTVCNLVPTCVSCSCTYTLICTCRLVAPT